MPPINVYIPGKIKQNGYVIQKIRYWKSCCTHIANLGNSLQFR
jgi:hypothetical protein